MGRLFKEGLDYFPLNTINDDKLDLIEAEFGLTGFAIIIKIWAKIYENSYYYKWGENEKLLFKKRINVDIKTIDDVIKKSIERGLFNNETYQKYNILTSRGIQKRYLDAIKRRKSITIIKEYWLLDKNDDNNDIYDDIYFKNVGNNTQSKVKESKVKESKEEYKQDFEKLWERYPKKLGKTKAYNHFKAQVKSDKDLIDIEKALDNYLQSKNVKEKNMEFIQHGSTWFNNYWRDWVYYDEKTRKPVEESEENFTPAPVKTPEVEHISKSFPPEVQAKIDKTKRKMNIK